MRQSVAASAFALFALPGIDAHGNLLCPAPRQKRDQKYASWTYWMGITVPGDGKYNPGSGNAANLNAGIGGGLDPNGIKGELPGGHDICGGMMASVDPTGANYVSSYTYGEFGQVRRCH